MNWVQRALLAAAFAAVTAWVSAGEVLTYDGTLTTEGLPANGLFDLRFRLYDGPDPESSVQTGSTIELDDVEVWNGRFSVDLDFGMDTDDHSTGWLETEVARGDRLGGFTLLEPRQKVLDRSTTALQTSVPSGAVVFFNLAACPSGWTEHVDARGRAIVGLNVGGTLGGKPGVALSNLEGRVHNHTFSASTSTESGGFHNHIWSKVQLAGGDVQWQSYNAGGGAELVFVWGNGIGNEGSGIYPLAAQPNQTLYTTKGGTHTHGVTIGTTPTSSAETGFPYLQLLACRKE